MAQFFFYCYCFRYYRINSHRTQILIKIITEQKKKLRPSEKFRKEIIEATGSLLLRLHRPILYSHTHYCLINIPTFYFIYLSLLLNFFIVGMFDSVSSFVLKRQIIFFPVLYSFCIFLIQLTSISIRVGYQQQPQVNRQHGETELLLSTVRFMPCEATIE